MLSSRGAAYKARKQYIAPLELYYRIRCFSYLYFTPPGLFFKKVEIHCYASLQDKMFYYLSPLDI